MNNLQEQEQPLYTREDMWKAMLWANTHGGHLSKHEEFLNNYPVQSQPILQEQEQKEILLTALNKICEMNYQQAKDQYGDRNKAKNWSCVKIAEEAIKKCEAKPILQDNVKLSEDIFSILKSTKGWVAQTEKIVELISPITQRNKELKDDNDKYGDIASAMIKISDELFSLRKLKAEQQSRITSLETANAFHKKAAEDAVAEQGRLIKEVESDTVEFAHKIGIAILKHSFEVIETSFRKSVVEVGKIVMEFDKEGIDIVAHPEF